MEIKILRDNQERFDVYGKLYMYSVSLYLNMWGITHHDDIEIIIETKRTKEISESFLEDGMAGVIPLSDNKFLFFIDIESISKSEGNTLEDVQIALAHESVHIKQYYTKELEIINDKLFWKGKDVSDFPQNKLPFEIEARSFEYDMAIGFLEEYMQFHESLEEEIIIELGLERKECIENVSV